MNVTFVKMHRTQMYFVSYMYVLVSLLTRGVLGIHRECVSYSKPGDVILGGLFPIHYVAGLGRCTEKQSPWGTMLSEAMIFAVDRVNQRSDLLPNVTLGFDLRDDCRSDDLALWHALSLVNALNPNETSGFCRPEPTSDKVIGIVGTSETFTSIVAAKAAALYKVPVISYKAAGDELGDPVRFPFFLRTVPQLSLEVKALVDLLYTFGWEYVSLLHSTDSDYLHSALMFQEIAPQFDICVAYSAAIRSSAAINEVTGIVAGLDRYPKARVVVIIGDKFTGKMVMAAAQKSDKVGRYQWVGGSRWGYMMKEEGLADISDGAIFVRSHRERVEGFAQFAEAKEPVEPDVSPWYKDLAEDWLNSTMCTNITECPLRVGDSGDSVVNSVYAIAHAFHDLMIEQCANATDCRAADMPTGDRFLAKLLGVKFQGANGAKISFDSSGNTGGKFVITNLRERDGEHEVGLWDSSFVMTDGRLTINASLVQFTNQSQRQPRSVCVEECKIGQIVVPLEEKCCWGCKDCLTNEIVVNRTSCLRCPKKQWPSEDRSECQPITPSTFAWSETVVVIILGLSGLGVVLCGLTIAGLFVYNQHPLIKASSRELSSICVAGLTVTFAGCVVLLVKPSYASCISVELLLALCATLIYAPTLLKVNRIFRIFRKARKSTQRPKFISPKHQVVACLVLIAVQVMLSILSAAIAPSTPVELIGYPESQIELFCSFGRGFVVSCCYNLVLILACCVFALKARNVPSNYNESKFIAVSVYSALVLCLAAVPVYVTAVAVLQKVATVCLAIIFNSYLTLVCLYLPKLYAVRFVDNEDMSTSDWRGTNLKTSTLTSNQIQPSTSGTAP